LAGVSVHACAKVFYGFEAPLLVEFDVGDVPTELAGRLVTFVGEFLSCLDDGVTDVEAVRRRIAPMADALALWVDEHEPDSTVDWVRILAESLSRRLVVRSK
jgi:hypothetical protein